MGEWKDLLVESGFVVSYQRDLLLARSTQRIWGWGCCASVAASVYAENGGRIADPDGAPGSRSGAARLARPSRKDPKSSKVSIVRSKIGAHSAHCSPYSQKRRA